MEKTSGLFDALTSLLGASGATVAQSALFSTGLVISLFIVGWIFKFLLRRMELKKDLQLANFEAGDTLRDELRQELVSLRRQHDAAKTRLLDCQRRYLTERNVSRRLGDELRRLKAGGAQ